MLECGKLVSPPPEQSYILTYFETSRTEWIKPNSSATQKEEQNMTVVFSLLAGLVIGAVFALLRLPVPAPPTIGGVVGIAGLALGAYFTNLLIERLS